MTAFFAIVLWSTIMAKLSASFPTEIFFGRWRVIPTRASKSLDQIMTHNPITVRRNTPIIEAVSKMFRKRINCLPVVEDDGSVCGIVTSTDLLKSYQQLLELVQKQAR